MRISTAALLSLPLLAAARHGYGHGHSYAHGVHHRALEVEVVTVTEVIYTTVIAAKSSALRSSAPASLPMETPAATPSVSSASNDSNSYHILVAVAGSASVRNSCDYPIYLTSEGPSTCEPGVECELIAPNSTYTEKMRNCKDGGIALKVSKTQDMQNPMQFEYSIWPTDKTIVSYDISFLNCMKNEQGEKDLTACAGQEGGIQAVGGTGDDAGCPGSQCQAGEWCNNQAYVVAEFGYQPGAPVGACAVEKGVAFELCAGSR